MRASKSLDKALPAVEPERLLPHDRREGSRLLSSTVYSLIGVANQRLKDLPGLCLACVWADIDYYDDLSDVWNGTNVTYDCEITTTTGWVEDSCSSASNHVSGLSWVHHEATGEFRNTNLEDNDFQLWVFTRGYPNGTGDITCTREGTFDILPWLGTHWDCEGGFQ